MNMSLDHNGNMVVPFKTFTITYDSERHATNLIIDGKHYGKNTSKVEFIHDASKNSCTLVLDTRVSFKPNGEELL